jgi:hypothetical protein
VKNSARRSAYACRRFPTIHDSLFTVHCIELAEKLLPHGLKGKTNLQAGDFKRVYQVIKDYSVYYTDAIVMQTGDPLTITEKESEWAGWVWCTNDNHDKSGWVPLEHLEQKG